MQIQQISSDQVHDLLHTRPGGLRADEVQALLAELGPNRIETRRGLWWARSLVRQFLNFFSLLLDLSAAICFTAARLQPGEGMDVLGGALLGVSVLNALFSFAQEYRAERAMEALRRLLPQRVLVRRDGVEREEPADALVPGDVIVLREGDRLAADARIVACDGLLVNNAPLTGESRPLALTAAAAGPDDTEPANLALAGCTVLRGRGEAVVFATGIRSRFGRIASLSAELRRAVSPLERETAHMVRMLTVIAVAMGLAFFAWGVYAQRSLWVNLVFMMGIIVANVPEGLLPTFTLSLAMGSLRMARRNVLVKSLTAVEALGSVHVICTDKTGTLTENRLAIARLVDARGETLAEGEAARALLRTALLASDLRGTPAGFSGDPLDVAIAERHGAGSSDLVASVARRFPFDVEKRRSAGVAPEGAGALFAVKGAIESLVPLLASGSGEGAVGVVHTLATRGYRVIAVASRRLPAMPGADVAQEALEHELVLDGFLCLEDPLRAEVPDAVRRCAEAGIRVVMVTGDHPDTAMSVARAAGIVASGEEAAPLMGEDLARLREQDLVEELRGGTRVFARTTPEQKMKIVAALHELGLVVAVTGDGVNDAPALKAADVGVAMGRGGTDVARESAQVVLLDDNFASIVAGVEEGRAIFANIGKFTNYVLVSNGPEILPYLLYILFPVPLALTVIQILSIDLGTDIVPSIALGQEPPDPQVMREPPRPRDAALLTRDVVLHSYGFLGLMEAAFSLALFFHVLHAGGWEWGQMLAGDTPLYRSATGITLASIMLMQIGNLAGRRSVRASGLDVGLLRNPYIVAGVAMEIAFSWAVLYAPPVAHVLGTGPVPANVYACAWLGIPLVFGLDYLRKSVAVRLAGRSQT